MRLARGCRAYFKPPRPRRPQPSTTDHDLIRTLLKNPELSLDDARNELRWIKHAQLDNDLLSLVTRRAKGEPLQYILGSTDFGPIELLVRPPTLIPRPETAFVFERFASLVRSRLSHPVRVLDLCTGSGAIPLLLSHFLGDRLKAAHGIDNSPEALSLARNNIRHLADTQVTTSHADLFAPTSSQTLKELSLHNVDVITANPPYIPRSEWETLPASVKEWEDSRALVGDDTDGLSFYHRIAELVESDFIAAKLVGVEIGHGQGDRVESIFKAVGLRTETWFDQYDKQRLVLGERA